MPSIKKNSLDANLKDKISTALKSIKNRRRTHVNNLKQVNVVSSKTEMQMDQNILNISPIKSFKQDREAPCIPEGIRKASVLSKTIENSQRNTPISKKKSVSW